MSASEVARVYCEIIDAVIGEHPKFFTPSEPESHFSVEPLQTTHAYKVWTERAHGDVQFIESLGEKHFQEGKDAVAHLVLLSVHVVKQMLAKGVEPRVAIGLLPSEIANRVHYMYWNTQT